MSERRYRTIAESIADQVYSGKYQIGQKLPTERELALSFSVGRPVIREAIVALELYGLVSVKQGSGIHVLPWQSQPLKVNIFDRGVNPFELVDARRMVESEIAAIAAIIISERELFELQALIQVMKESLDDMARWVEADRQFHSCIARAARNTALLSIVDSLWSLLTRGIHWNKLCDYIPDVELTGERIDEHCAIYDALARHDPDGARAAMDAHLKRAKATLLLAAEELRLAEE